MRFYQTALLIFVLALAACGGSPSRTVVSDRAPSVTLDASNIQDAVPRADPIHAAGNKSPYRVLGVEYRVMEDATGYRERGIASWYGQKFHGRPTSNGETFSVYGVTAAHKTLPIPSYVRVTNLENGRQAVVRVNDRGPFHPDRIIDLSYAAAVKLGFAKQGTARVEVALIPVAGVKDLRTANAGPPWRDMEDQPQDATYLQVGAFGTRAAAQRVVDRLRVITDEAILISQLGSGDNALYRVRIGPVSPSSKLLSLRDRLVSQGYDAPRLLSP